MTTPATPPHPMTPPAPAPAPPAAAATTPAPADDKVYAFQQGTPTPAKPLTGTFSNVYAFTVHCKSDILRGAHRGETIYVVEPDPATAVTKIQTYYGTDLLTYVGPILQLAGVAL